VGQLDGKVALVAGGASDIGRATVLRLAEAGAAVVIGDVASEAAASLAADVAATRRARRGPAVRPAC
jgi:NAD(P)-dependent dehydrogenase (short-subunit alcohol dehydrogenase family)